MNKLALHAVTLSCGMLLSLSAHAVGAIAVDDNVEYEVPAWGFATGEPNRKAAERRAVEYCREHGRNCRAVVWFETCGAYAASAKHYGYGWGASKAKATGDALKMCASNSCKVIVAECER